jgi:hypothetical protein
MQGIRMPFFISSAVYRTHPFIPSFLSFTLIVSFCAIPWSEEKDLFPDTWVATDALGRKTPTSEEAGPPKQDKRRTVGIFYVTWHILDLGKSPPPYTADVTQILKLDPKARLDTNHPLWERRKYSSYHWGEPELGYFLSQDPYVIRRDLSMLTDALVDVLILDVTNAVCYWDEWEALFRTMEQMREEGNRVPRFCFWAFNGPCITVVEQIFDRIYAPGKYRDLWFYWDEKPLLLYNDRPDRDANGTGIRHPNPRFDAAARTDPTHPHYGDPRYTEEFLSDYSPEIKQFFTLRMMWWGYYQWGEKRAVGSEDYWSFGYDLGDERVRRLRPEERVSKHLGRHEQYAVTPAQHASTGIGKSWTLRDGEPALNEYDLPSEGFVPWLGTRVADPQGYGAYFQERWDEALQADPDFLYLNDWNEWTAGKYDAPAERPIHFLGRDNSFFFVDQYNAEFNRTIQPMKGGYTDNYYMQMVQNIRRYKGVRPIPRQRGFSRIVIDGSFSDWEKISPEFRDTVGDTAHRDFPGYGGLHYTDTSGRNDIVACKVARDAETVYFYVETREALTPHTDPRWMLLFLDTDTNAQTGLHGYDFVINYVVKDANTTTLSQHTAEQGTTTWRPILDLPMHYEGNRLELAVPIKALGLKTSPVVFDFHWADNPSDVDNIITLCTSGDSAPNRRFNYRYFWENATDITP